MRSFPTGWANRLSALDRSYLLYAGIVLLLMYSLGQLTAPFIAHDEYDWLLSGFEQGFESPWSKTFSEGRWGNFIWSKFSDRLNGYSAFGIYLAAYSLMCVVIARCISSGAGILAALMLFLAPMGAETTQWPVTQVTGVVVTIVAAYAMHRATNDWARVAVLSLAVIACYLFYPSFGPLFLLLYAATMRHGGVNEGLRGGAMYAGSFVAAVLFVFTLNYFFHGRFTIQPAPWREATPLFSGGSLASNVDRYLAYYGAVKQLWPALVSSAIAFAICIRARVRSRECIWLLAYGALLLLMDASLSIVSGLSLPVRSSLWLWLLICIPVVFLIYERRTAWIGVVLAVPLLWLGLSAWGSTYANSRTVYPAMNALGQELSRTAAANSGRFDEVIMFGDVHADAMLRPLHSNRALRNYLYKEFKVLTRPCEPALCARIQEEVGKRPEVPQWMLLDRKLVWILSPESGNLY